MTVPLDVIALTRTLVSCRSVTPADDGAMRVLSEVLQRLGFNVELLNFGEGPKVTPNLFARLGEGAPHLCFAGHTDVVPPGTGWTFDPFGGEVHSDLFYGRGVSDMKGGIAAFVTAVSRILDERTLNGSVSLLITGDEEGAATYGTQCVLPWMRHHGHIPDFCLLIGSPGVVRNASPLTAVSSMA